MVQQLLEETALKGGHIPSFLDKSLHFGQKDLVLEPRLRNGIRKVINALHDIQTR
jgi:hypothetical protein